MPHPGQNDHRTNITGELNLPESSPWWTNSDSVTESIYIYGGKIQFRSDLPSNMLRMKNKWYSNLCNLMYLPLARKYPKRKINLDLDPTSEIVTDIMKKNSGGWLLKSMVTHSSCGGRIGKRSKLKMNWNLWLMRTNEVDQ